MSEDIRTILAELKDDHSNAYDIYKTHGGDDLTINLINEFNAHPLVIKKIEEKHEVKVIQQMAKSFLMLLNIDYQPMKVGNHFEKANKKLKEALSILEDANTPEEKYIKDYWLAGHPLILKNIKETIEILDKNKQGSRGGKDHLSLLVADKIFKSWCSMREDTAYHYKEGEDFKHSDNEPASVFAVFVEAVRLELKRVIKQDQYIEYPHLKGLKDNIDDLKKLQKQ